MDHGLQADLPWWPWHSRPSVLRLHTVTAMGVAAENAAGTLLDTTAFKNEEECGCDVRGQLVRRAGRRWIGEDVD